MTPPPYIGDDAEQKFFEGLTALCNTYLTPERVPALALMLLRAATITLCTDLGDEAEAIAFIKRTLDRWQPDLRQNLETDP